MVVVDRWRDVIDTVRRVTAQLWSAGATGSARAYCRVLVSSAISRMLTRQDLLGDVTTLEAVLESFRWQTNALLLGKWPRLVLHDPRFRRYEQVTAAFVRRHRRALDADAPPGWFDPSPTLPERFRVRFVGRRSR